MLPWTIHLPVLLCHVPSNVVILPWIRPSQKCVDTGQSMSKQIEADWAKSLSYRIIEAYCSILMYIELECNYTLEHSPALASVVPVWREPQSTQLLYKHRCMHMHKYRVTMQCIDNWIHRPRVTTCAHTPKSGHCICMVALCPTPHTDWSDNINCFIVIFQLVVTVSARWHLLGCKHMVCTGLPTDNCNKGRHAGLRNRPNTLSAHAVSSGMDTLPIIHISFWHLVSSLSFLS